MRRILVSGIAALAAVGLLGACGGGSDSKTVKTKDGEVKVSGDKNSGKVTVKTKDGTTSIGAGSGLPDDFPKDEVPLPKGGKVTGYISGSGSNQGWTLTIDVKDTKASAASYKTQLEDADYTIEEGLSVGSGEGSFESYSAKGDKWDVNVIASKDAKSGEDALLVSVQPHDKADDTTSTSS